MEFKNVFKIAPLVLIIVGITMLAMNSNQPVTKIKILTSDEQEIEIPKNLAFESSMIKEMAEDVGESNLLLIPITARALNLILRILQAINAAPDQIKFKRADGKYIAQRIQALIDQALAAADKQTLAELIYTAEFLDLEQIANGAIRLMVQRALAENPRITVDNIEITWFGDTNWPNRLNPILEYQYRLVKNGNIPELSVTDYIAINGMPTVSKRFGLGRDVTNLEGLGTIPNIANVETLIVRAKLCFLPKNIFTAVPNLTRLDLSDNLLDTLPEEIFKPLANLNALMLNNNKLINLPEKVLYPLTNISEINLSSNQLSELPTNIFAQVPRAQIFLTGNPITQRMTKEQFIAAHPNSTNMSSIIW